MPLKRIRLELARTTDHPEGDPDHGYEFVAPLAADGFLDPEGWKSDRQLCTVHHFAPGEDDEHGTLVHTRSGWSFSYAPGEDDDEPIFRFSSHRFAVGEYVSVTEHDGETRTFKVVRVDDPPALRH